MEGSSPLSPFRGERSPSILRLDDLLLTPPRLLGDPITQPPSPTTSPSSPTSLQVTYDNNGSREMSQDGPLCVICQDEIHNREDTLVRLSCGHMYHYCCVNTYIEETDRSNGTLQGAWKRCPVCRALTVPPSGTGRRRTYAPHPGDMFEPIPDMPPPLERQDGQEPEPRIPTPRTGLSQEGDESDDDIDDVTYETLLRAQHILRNEVAAGTQFVFHFHGPAEINMTSPRNTPSL